MATKGKSKDNTGMIALGVGAIALGYYLMNKGNGQPEPPPVTSPHIGVVITAPIEGDTLSSLFTHACGANIINQDNTPHDVWVGMSVLSDEEDIWAYRNYAVKKVSLAPLGVAAVGGNWDGDWYFDTLGNGIVKHKIVVSAWDVYPSGDCETSTTGIPCHRLASDIVHFNITLTGY